MSSVSLIHSKDKAKSYIRYILYFSIGSVLFSLAYTLSVMLIYFMIGIFLLPLVILAAKVSIYFLWRWSLKSVERSGLKYVALAFPYIILVYLLIIFDNRVSWFEDGNLQLYIDLLHSD